MKRFILVSALLSSLTLLACTEPPAPTVNLNRAVQIGDIDQLRRHIHWKTDLDQPNSDGDPPLHVAASAGRVAIAHELARSGADLEGTNSAGQTPLYVSLAHGRTQVALMLVDQGAQIDSQALLVELVRNGVIDRDALNFLTKSGAQINRIDANGDAPLHVAIKNGHLQAVRRLIIAGADINQPDGDGRLPLRIARESAPGPDARFIRSTLERSGARADPVP